VGKRFRRPKKATPVSLLTRNGEDVAGMIRQAERVEQIVKRLQQAIYQHDEIVARALIDRAEIEARYGAMLARGLRDGTLCA
jgi:hypothetical protein